MTALMMVITMLSAEAEAIILPLRTIPDKALLRIEAVRIETREDLTRSREEAWLWDN
jgi:hypothetical protein